MLNPKTRQDAPSCVDCPVAGVPGPLYKLREKEVVNRNIGIELLNHLRIHVTERVGTQFNSDSNA